MNNFDIEFRIWKDPNSKCIRWSYTKRKYDDLRTRVHVKGWEGPSLWYGKEFFRSFRLWKKQYRKG